MKLFDGTKIPLLSRAIDAYSLRHRTIAANLSNITTAGYRARTVSFEEELADAMNQGGLRGVVTHERHLPVGGPDGERLRPAVHERRESDPQRDMLASGVNDVDLDEEMTELARNQIRYRFAARLLSETFRGLQKSIRGSL
jgi:flagellar basal-body rod protein FlgB